MEKHFIVSGFDGTPEQLEHMLRNGFKVDSLILNDDGEIVVCYHTYNGQPEKLLERGVQGEYDAPVIPSEQETSAEKKRLNTIQEKIDELNQICDDVNYCEQHKKFITNYENSIWLDRLLFYRKHQQRIRAYYLAKAELEKAGLSADITVDELQYHISDLERQLTSKLNKPRVSIPEKLKKAKVTAEIENNLRHQSARKVSRDEPVL